MWDTDPCSTLSSMPTHSVALSPELSDAFLLTRVGRGDVRAYELIYRRYRRQAHAYAYRLCGRHCVTEDVVQEAFLAVWKGAGTYTESRGPARNWMFTLVRNRAIDARRRHARVQGRETALDDVPELLDGSALTDVAAERRERARAVHVALKRLPAAQRQTVVLSHFRGLSHQETAALLGHSIGTVKGRIRLGQAKLRQDLVDVAGAP
jgi:RNA polymerase sigma-70 factor, ECF subfamily